MRKFYILVIFSCLCSYLSAQEIVTIDQCQEWAVAQTSASVQKELNEQILKTNLHNASSHLFPKLSVNGQFEYASADMPGGEERPIPPFDEHPNNANLQYHIGLDFEQTVFEGCKSFYGREYEVLKNDAEIYKIQLSINEIKKQVISLYLNYLILDKQLSIVENAQSTLDDQIKQMRVLLKEGVIPKNTLSQLELEALKMEQNIDELKSRKMSIIASLSILTGKDLSMAEFLMPQLPQMNASDASSRLEFAIFDNQLKQMDFQRKLHFSKSLPKISLFASGGYGRPDYRYFFSAPQWYYFAGVRLHVPIIDWAKTSGLGKVINIQKNIVASQESDFRKSNQIAIQEKQYEIERIEKMLALDRQITGKYEALTKTYSSQLSNGTITVFDYIRQSNDEMQFLLNQEIHNIQLLKAKYELLALKGQL